MKKFLVFFVLATFVANFSFAQPYVSNKEIANTIAKSSWVNNLKNPDLVYPGQNLFFRLPDGTLATWPVSKGDCQWTVVRTILGSYDNTVPYEESLPKMVGEDEDNLWSAILDFLGTGLNALWLLLLIFFLFVIYKIIKSELNKPKDVDPVTAGPAQVPGGVPDSGAHSRIVELAEARFPSATLVINNIRRGFLSGPGYVYYANNKKKKINLKDVPAYAGEVSINGNIETIYFLQPCGNDARRGEYMEGNEFRFVPSVFIGKDGSESPLYPTKTAESQEVVVEEKVEIANRKVEDAKEVAAEEKKTETSGSEKFQIQMKILNIAEKAAEGNLHSVILELDSDGKLKTSINYKSEAGGKNEKTGTEGPNK